MAFGLAGSSGSFQANMAILGGIVTGSKGEFLALPISSTVLGGLSGLDTNEWSRFYLSDSFGAASASVIQALNYLSASMDATSGDVTGPGSSTDNAIVRFDGTTGKLIQDTSVTTITDTGNIATEGSVSGASTLAGISLTLGDEGDEFVVSRLGRLQGGTGGATYDLRADGFVSGASSVHGNNLLVQSASVALEVSGGSLNIGGGDFTVSTLGAVAGGAGGDSYSLSAAGALSGANSIIAGTTVSGAGNVAGQSLNIGAANNFKIGLNGAVSSSTTAHFVDGITGKLVAVSSSVSGAGNVAGQSLNIGAADNFKVGILGALSSSTTAHFVDGITGKLVAVSSSVSGAGGFSGQTLAFGANGIEFATSIAGLVAGGAGGDSYSLAANGQISGANAVLAGTNVSGAGVLQGGSVSVGNGAGTISVAGAFVGSSFQGQSFQGSTLKVSSGNISGTVDTSVQFSNTGSAGGNNYKAALLISSSDIISDSNSVPFADQIPRMVMQGTGEDGGLADFMISISGGMLQVTQLTYGNALPLVN